MNSNRNINASAAVLWASAMLIAAMIIVQAGKLPGNAAFASTVSEKGSYTILTADSGKGGDVQPDEVVYVIDSRDQTMLVYEIENARQKRMVLRAVGPLDNLSRNARGRSSSQRTKH